MGPHSTPQHPDHGHGNRAPEHTSMWVSGVPGLTPPTQGASAPSHIPQPSQAQKAKYLLLYTAHCGCVPCAPLMCNTLGQGVPGQLVTFPTLVVVSTLQTSLSWERLCMKHARLACEGCQAGWHSSSE